MRKSSWVFGLLSVLVLSSSHVPLAAEDIPFEIRLNVSDQNGNPIKDEPFQVAVMVQKTGETLYGDTITSKGRGQLFSDATVSREKATGFVRTEVVRQLTGEKIVMDANSYIVGKPPVYYTASNLRFKNH